MVSLTNKTFNGIVTWLKQWFPDKTEINNSEPEYIVGTHGTSTTATWTGTCNKLTEIKDGTTIFYYLTSAGTTNVTLNLTLANGQTTGAKNVYFKGTTRLSTQYPINSIITLVYTTKRDNGCWYVSSANDNNSYNASHYGTVQFTAGEALTTRTLCGMMSDGKYYKISSGRQFLTAYPIIGTNGAIASGATGNNEYMPRYDESITNTKSMTLTNGKPVFIEGSAYRDGVFTVSSNVVTQTLVKGKYYWLVGFAYGNSNFRSNRYENILYYNGTNLIPVSNPTFTIIPNGTDDENHNDLNNYRIAGFYGQPANANTSYIDNLPNNNHTAFTLLVEQFDGYCKQTLTFINLSDPQTFIRVENWNNQSWGNWKEIAWATDAPTSHAHGRLSNGGVINYDTDTVGKVVVTDTSGNLRTISRLPQGCVDTSNFVLGTAQVIEAQAFENIETPAGTMQHSINYSIDQKIGELEGATGLSKFTLKHSQTFKGVNIKWYSDGLYVYCVVNGSFTGLTANGYTNIGTMTNKDYAPPFTIVEVLTGASALSTITITDTGILGVHNNTSGTSFTANTTSMYPLKSRMGGEVVPVVDSISLTSDKSILSAYDGGSAVLTATVTGTNVDGLEVEFFSGSTSLGTSVVSNGVATKSYSATGVGDISVSAECEETTSNTVTIEDCDVYISGETVPSYFSIPSGMTVTSNGEYLTISGTTSGEKVLWLPYTVTTDENYVFETEIEKAGTTQSIALYFDDGYGYQESGKYGAVMSSTKTVTKSVASGDVYSVKHENDTTTAYINDTQINTMTKTIINHRFGYYTNRGRVQYLKNIKIKRL